MREYIAASLGGGESETTPPRGIIVRCNSLQPRAVMARPGTKIFLCRGAAAAKSLVAAATQPEARTGRPSGNVPPRMHKHVRPAKIPVARSMQIEE